jgi:hypothetical protein
MPNQAKKRKVLNIEDNNDLQLYLYGWFLEGKSKKEGQELAVDYFGEDISERAAENAFGKFGRGGLPKRRVPPVGAVKNKEAARAVQKGKQLWINLVILLFFS